jgi:hypothetical protein
MYVSYAFTHQAEEDAAWVERQKEKLAKESEIMKDVPGNTYSIYIHACIKNGHIHAQYIR